MSGRREEWRWQTGFVKIVEGLEQQPARPHVRPAALHVDDPAPVYGSSVDCRLFCFAEAQGVIKAGRRVGWDEDLY